MTEPRLTQIRTRVPEGVYDRITEEAALSGVSIAALVRDTLADVFGEGPGASRSTVEMTLAQKAQWLAWNDAATDDADKRGWRARVDTVLRKRGTDLPPLDETNGPALIQWAQAVHPFTRCADVIPPKP